MTDETTGGDDEANVSSETVASESPDTQGNQSNVTNGPTTAAVSSQYKVQGKEAVTSGAGVVGHNTATSGESVGVEGVTNSSSSDAAGVRASASNGGTGLRATADGNSAIEANSTGFATIKAETSVDTSNAIFAENKATSGNSWGVRGDTFSDASLAYGVRGIAKSTSGSPNGVGGVTEGAADGAKGVYGAATDPGSGETYGVYGTTSSSAGYGVYSADDSKTDGNHEVTGHQTVGKSGLSAFLSSNTNIPDDTDTTVPFDATNTDDFGGHNTPSTGVYEVQQDGDYHVDFLLDWSSGFADGDQITYRVKINGSTDGGLSADTDVTGSTDPARGFSKALFGLTETDTIEVEVYHNNGVTQTLSGSAEGETYLTIHKFG